MPRVQAPLPSRITPAQWLVDRIVKREPDAERSLMHRYNIGRVRTVANRKQCLFLSLLVAISALHPVAD